ncbi:MAG: TonB-dependent receptor, partial [Pseudomonadota bacterium]
DEGRFVGLRGLDQRYTFISINGGQIASTDRSDRDINIESIPPTAVKRLEVYKAVTPDLDGQSVGGVINLVTRSAFDEDGLYAVVNAQVGWHEQIGDLPQSFDDPSPRVDFALSNLFANDTIGVLVSGTYFDKKRDQGRPILGYGSNDTGPFVNQILPLDYANQIVRWNGLAKVEFRPTDTFRATLEASRFDYQYDEVRYRFDVFEEGDVQNQTATTGEFASANGRARFDRFPLGQTIDTVQARIEFEPTERSLIEFSGNYSYGRQGHPEPNGSWRIASTPGLGYAYDISTEDADDADLVSIVFNDPSVLLDLSNYTFDNYTDGYFRNEEDVTEFRADYSWNTDGKDAGFGFKVGAKYRNLEKDRIARATRYTLADGETLTLEQFASAGQTQPYTEEYLPGLNYPVINPDVFDAFFAANPDVFVATPQNRETAFYNVQEDVTALYAMGTWNMGRHTAKGGVRYEYTEVSTVAALNASTDRVARTTDYEDVLPSFVYTYDLAEGMKVRAGYAQALGRPNHPDLAGAETFDDANLTVRRANTALQPRESESFDLAFDWFIDPGQFFSVAAFHKIIDNQISSETTEEVINGLTFEVTQPVNIDEVKVSGLEFSYTDDSFDFLPAPFDGFGVVANLTLIDGEDGPAPGGNLVAQPDYLYNIAGLYEYGPFQGRLTYNVVDDRPLSSSRAELKYEQLDLQLRWQLNENFQVQFEGRNITNNPRKNFFYDTGLLREINDFGNSYWFGVSYRY